MRKPGVLLRLDRLQYACHPDVGARPAPLLCAPVCSVQVAFMCFHPLSFLPTSTPCNYPPATSPLRSRPVLCYKH